MADATKGCGLPFLLGPYRAEGTEVMSAVSPACHDSIAGVSQTRLKLFRHWDEGGEIPSQGSHRPHFLEIQSFGKRSSQWRRAGCRVRFKKGRYGLLYARRMAMRALGPHRYIPSPCLDHGALTETHSGYSPIQQLCLPCDPTPSWTIPPPKFVE
jgi:hypothetical protein